MTENDIIAEYVKERYPFLIDSFGFAVYRLNKRLEHFGVVVSKNIKKLIKGEMNKNDKTSFGTNFDYMLIDESAFSAGKDDISLHNAESEDWRNRSSTQYKGNANQERQKDIGS